MSRIRLVCPNCGAQYEVPLNVIPDEGRDVQCSSCAHTWYQNHPDQDQALAEELGQPVADVEWDQTLDDAPQATAPAPQPEPEPASDEIVAPASDPEPTPAPAPEPAFAEPPAPAQPAPRRNFDPELVDMFREEREFEARQRAAETLETQPDLGLQSPDEDERARRERQSRERMARMRGADPAAAPHQPAYEPNYDAPSAEASVPPAPHAAPSALEHEAATIAAAAAVGSRRDLLPDVEEINQTLRSDADPRPQDFPGDGLPPQEEPRQGGFGRGFLSMVLLGGLGLGTYAYASKISAIAPPLAPIVQGYVAKVDQGRVWLDGQVTALLTQLDSMASENQTAPTEPSDTADSK